MKKLSGGVASPNPKRKRVCFPKDELLSRSVSYPYIVHTIHVYAMCMISMF